MKMLLVGLAALVACAVNVTAFAQNKVISTKKPQVVPYQNLATNKARIQPPQKPVARVVKNADNLKIKLNILSLDEAKNENELWKVLKALGDGVIEDTVVFVCEYTLSTDQFGLWLLPSYIVGLSHVNAQYISTVRKDFTIPAYARKTLGFFSVGNMSDTNTKEDLGLAVAGEGTIIYIWMVPSMKTKFRIVFPPFDETKARKHEIEVQLDSQ